MLRKGDDRDILVAKYEIEYEETFHLKNLYKLMHDWYVEEGWTDINDDGDKAEYLYFERILGTGAKEHHIWWRLKKVPKNNNYFRFFLKIDFQSLNMKSVEIVQAGKKFKTDSGDIILRVEAWLQLDYMNKWKSHPILKMFDTIYRKRWYKPQIEALKKDLYRDAYKLSDTIKQYLKIKTLQPVPKSFQPVKGV